VAQAQVQTASTSSSDEALRRPGNAARVEGEGAEEEEEANFGRRSSNMMPVKESGCAGPANRDDPTQTFGRVQKCANSSFPSPNGEGQKHPTFRRERPAGESSRCRREKTSAEGGGTCCRGEKIGWLRLTATARLVRVGSTGTVVVTTAVFRGTCALLGSRDPKARNGRGRLVWGLMI
jgi:hypothetical protein